MMGLGMLSSDEEVCYEDSEEELESSGAARALLQYVLCCGFCELECLVVIVCLMRRKSRNGRGI